MDYITIIIKQYIDYSNTLQNKNNHEKDYKKSIQVRRPGYFYQFIYLSY
jgi:hypothetical protein